MDQILDMEHPIRSRMIDEIGRINEQLNEHGG
jgi:hypothetical protein